MEYPVTLREVGLGWYAGADAFEGAALAARGAIDDGGIEVPSLVFAFVRTGLDPEQVFRGIRSVVGPEVPIFGGSGIGVMTEDFLSSTGACLALAVFDRAFLSARVEREACVAGDLQAAGARLGAKLGPIAENMSTLIFFDSMERRPGPDMPPVLHSSRPILEGILSRLAPQSPIYGAGLMGEFDMSSSFVFGGDAAGEQMLAGAALEGDFRTYAAVTHGCAPLDGIYRRITRQQGPIIYELDGRPIVQVIDEVFGGSAWRASSPVRTLTLGINGGPRFAPYREDAYVNRLIVGALPGDEGIVLFEDGPQEGDEIQFLMRDSAKMMESARQAGAETIRRIRADGLRPAFALYIDCAGRAASWSLTMTEEADIVREAMREAAVPFLGFYSGIEIAPVGGVSRGLDWTGVLLVLAVAGS